MTFDRLEGSFGSRGNRDKVVQYFCKFFPFQGQDSQSHQHLPAEHIWTYANPSMNTSLSCRAILSTLIPRDLPFEWGGPRYNVNRTPQVSRMHDNAFVVSHVMKRPPVLYGPRALFQEWGNPSCCIIGLRALIGACSFRSVKHPQGGEYMIKPLAGVAAMDRPLFFSGTCALGGEW